MNISKIRKTEKNTISVYINDFFSEEYAAEFLFGEDFSDELISFIHRRYPKFKKGIIKIIAGTVTVSVIQFSGNAARVSSSLGSYTTQAEVQKRFAMSYIYFGTPQQQLAALSAAADDLTTVSPLYFELTENGNLSLTSQCSTDFTNAAHDVGIAVTPFLSNHWDRSRGAAALSNADTLAAQLTEAAELYNLDGINIDIENLTHEHRAEYTAFIKKLRDALPSEKTISVAVAPNPYGWATGWQASYDYAELAKVCDYLIIMAYDEHYSGSSPGAVASIQFTEKSVTYALKTVPAEKIVLAIPFYGRYWKNGTGGYGISLADVNRLVSSYESSTGYDSLSKTPYATVTVKSGDEKPTVGGRRLDPGTYTIYYENDISIREKLMLIGKYNLKGSGSWSLGQETPDVWNYYTKWANGMYCADIAESWAREEIMDALLSGDMKGVGGEYFEPDRGITRAEFVTLILRKLNIDIDEALPNKFTDTAAHWAKNEIATAEKHGIVFGSGNRKFLPDKTVTRREACSILRRALNLEYGGSRPQYSDVSPGNTFYEDIAAAAEYGLFKGFPDGSFKPGNGITRAEAAAVIGRIKP